MASLFSSLTVEAAKWHRHRPLYTDIDTAIGHGSGATRADVARALVNTTSHTPTVIVFQLSDDPTNLYIGHNPTFYNADIGSATNYDNHVMVLVGDNIPTAVGWVLEDNAFGRSANLGFYNRAYITGANGYASAPPEYQFDRHAAGAGTPDTDEY